VEQQRIFDDANESEIVSTQTVSSKTRTVETITVGFEIEFLKSDGGDILGVLSQ
jgi:hypothetical protein